MKVAVSNWELSSGQEDPPKYTLPRRVSSYFRHLSVSDKLPHIPATWRSANRSLTFKKHIQRSKETLLNTLPWRFSHAVVRRNALVTRVRTWAIESSKRP